MKGINQILVAAICLNIFLTNPSPAYSQSQASKKNNVEIAFLHYVDETLLRLDSVEYKNELNQAFSITKFKYYIGNLSLNRKNGGKYICNEYFLIDEEKTSSKNIYLEKVPDGEYISINFTIGVDSIDNCSGAQSGVLDPINGMFWTWNTGYIFMKLEGVSEFSSSPNATFEYHIGGYKDSHNCIRNVSLSFNKSILVTSKSYNKIEIKTDVLEILKSPNIIDFLKLPSVTDFNNATYIADNYSDMFSVLISE